jgi:hypothetical protein
MFSSLTLLAGHVYNEEMRVTCANTGTQPASQSGLALRVLFCASTAVVTGRGGGPGGIGRPTVAGLLQFPAHHHAAAPNDDGGVCCWRRYELVGDKAPPPPALLVAQRR